MRYEKHEYNIFPAMQEEDFLRVKEDIRRNGYDPTQPIWLYEGKVLDGINRCKICAELGVEPVTKEFVGTDREAAEFVMRTNKRRNLTSSQWAAIAAEAEDLWQEISRVVEEGKRQRVSKARRSSWEAEDEEIIEDEDLRLGQICPNLDSVVKVVRTADIAAEVFNTSKTYINEARRIREENPEAFERVKAGEIPLYKVVQEEKKQARIQEIEEQKRAIEQGELPHLEGLFDVIVVDPPWEYGREYDPEGSRAASPYPEMSLEELEEIELPAKDDSVLFLWTTHRFLFDAKALMDYWGFSYKATLVWDKEKMGLGSWFRMQCEFCLVGVKGSPVWDNKKYRDIMREARREHSRKPELFYNMVEEITVGRRLDYFSRQQRPGWEVFGDETEKYGDG